MMLMAFVINATPKKYFHDIFSHHTDTAFPQTRTDEKQLITYSYNCGFVNYEVTSSFTDEVIPLAAALSEFIVADDTKIIFGFIEDYTHLLQLRGPPIG